MHVRYWGRSGTAARYLCSGTYQLGGEYCIAFGGATVDRRFGELLLEVLAPLGVEASLEALGRCDAQDDARRITASNQLEQLRYEAGRAFEQYNEVDPRNRLVAAELERRWNEKLASVGQLEAKLVAFEAERPPLSSEQREQIRALGRDFGTVWWSDECPPEMKKQLARTVINEVVVDLDESTQKLEFIIHWAGGVHTCLRMDKPRSPFGHKSSEDDLAIIGKMAPRYGDSTIARVLSKLGRRTGKGKRWNQQRVKSARRRAGIGGRVRDAEHPDVLSLAGAARHAGVSNTTITRLVGAGLLSKNQEIPWAPWEISRDDLDREPVVGIIQHLRQTGRLDLNPSRSSDQPDLL